MFNYIKVPEAAKIGLLPPSSRKKLAQLRTILNRSYSSFPHKSRVALRRSARFPFFLPLPHLLRGFLRSPSLDFAMAIAAAKRYWLPLVLFALGFFFQLVVLPRSFPPSHYDGTRSFSRAGLSYCGYGIPRAFLIPDP